MRKSIVASHMSVSLRRCADFRADHPSAQFRALLSRLVCRKRHHGGMTPTTTTASPTGNSFSPSPFLVSSAPLLWDPGSAVPLQAKQRKIGMSRREKGHSFENQAISIDHDSFRATTLSANLSHQEKNEALMLHTSVNAGPPNRRRASQ